MSITTLPVVFSFRVINTEIDFEATLETLILLAAGESSFGFDDREISITGPPINLGLAVFKC